MKKQVRKIRLNRETLRHLDPAVLGKVPGGGEETSAIACDQHSDCACPTWNGWPCDTGTVC